MEKKYGVHIINVTKTTEEIVISSPVTLEKINNQVASYVSNLKKNHVVLIDKTGDYIGEISLGDQSTKGLPVVKHLAKYLKD